MLTTHRLWYRYDTPGDKRIEAVMLEELNVPVLDQVYGNPAASCVGILAVTTEPTVARTIGTGTLELELALEKSVLV